MLPFTVQWFLNDAEVYRYVPKARRELQRMVFNREAVRIDLESSKMIGEREHLLVLQSVARKQVGSSSSTRRAATTTREGCYMLPPPEIGTLVHKLSLTAKKGSLNTIWYLQSGEYKCQVTMDTPPFQFIQAAAYLSIMVLPERHPVISGEAAGALGLPAPCSSV